MWKSTNQRISWDYGTFHPPKPHSSNAHVQPSSGYRCLIFGWTLRLLPYFMSANSEGSGETARMRRLAWAFAGRPCDKYHSLMSWLKFTISTKNNPSTHYVYQFASVKKVNINCEFCSQYCANYMSTSCNCWLVSLNDSFLVKHVVMDFYLLMVNKHQ